MTRRGVYAITLGTLFAIASPCQEGVPAPPGLVPEQMWPAPTAADWQKPVAIRWQRSWDDAVRLSQETKRPILVCVNMDGEIASEHYAGIRYRDPELTKLYEPYVCVIASVYRHNPRDHDEQGNRIPCPRFHGVTCGEHIAIEPLLYEKFMDGKRIAPRHIMVELDGSETYDVFYMWDTDSVFQAIRDGIAKRTTQPKPIVAGDRSLLERVASPDSADRDAVESAWKDGDAAARRSLLDAALALDGDAPVELLRRAVFGLDAEQAQRARTGLTKAKAEGSVDLVADALRVPMDADERNALVGALKRLGTHSLKARMWASVHEGLGSRQATLDTTGWTKAIDEASTRERVALEYDRDRLLARIDATESAARRAPEDPTARIELAEHKLTEALEALALRGATGRYERVLIEDAHRTAQEAVKLGAAAPRANAVLALTTLHLGDRDAAYALAEEAARGVPGRPESRIAAALLRLFAHARQNAIATAATAKESWPPQYVTDVHSTYSLLARHPFGTDRDVADHFDFLKFFGTAQASSVLDQGLTRFPDSALLHARFRESIAETKGTDALESEYATRLRAENAAPRLRWFAGYASLVTAEAHRRAGRHDAALAAYDRGIAHFDGYLSTVGTSDPTADHYVAMALGGKARVAMQTGELANALTDLEASLTRHPSAAATADGLNLTTVDTARALLARFQQAGDAANAARVDAALARLDPELLLPPEYERGTQPPRRGQRRGR